ncbi:hypothetical protein DIPPA_34465 [Diplonema papillatum]|nr:hypothetical protein DIPPA_34465 [Diplonema papillatum]
MMYDGQCYTSFPTPPPPLAVQASPRRKLAPDEMDKSLQRLTFKKERKNMLVPLTPRVVLGSAAIEASNNRLYTQEMERRKRKKDFVTSKYVSKEPGTTLDSQAVSESVERLYRYGQQHLTDLSKTLDRKYNAKRETKALNREEIREYNDRFYTSRKDLGKENIGKLVDKYVLQHDLPRKVLTKEQQVCRTHM